MYQFHYGISCALEPQPQRQPVIIRGEIEHVAAEVRRAGYDAIELFIRDAGLLTGVVAGLPARGKRRGPRLLRHCHRHGV